MRSFPCSLACAALLTASCASSPPLSMERTPPRVDCRGEPNQLLPPPPAVIDTASMVRWGRGATAAFLFNVRQRAEEQRCLDDLRGKGVIR